MLKKTTTPACDKKMKKAPSLVDHYFLTFEQRNGERKVQHQGRIIGKVTENVYMVELYSWFSGCVTNRKLAALQDMIGWNLYDDHDCFIEDADKWGKKAD